MGGPCLSLVRCHTSAHSSEILFLWFRGWNGLIGVTMTFVVGCDHGIRLLLVVSGEVTGQRG